jgi:hypothetical protein
MKVSIQFRIYHNYNHFFFENLIHHRMMSKADSCEEGQGQGQGGGEGEGVEPEAAPFPIRRKFVPPINFSMVCPGICRSGYPNKKNFPFLKKIGIKSIL